jgi:hypothetical protein
MLDDSLTLEVIMAYDPDGSCTSDHVQTPPLQS